MRNIQILAAIWLLSTVYTIGLPCPLVDSLNSPINFLHEHIEALYKQMSATSKQDNIKLIYFNEQDVVHLHSYLVVFSRKVVGSLDESYIGIASRPRDVSASKIEVPYRIVKYIESDRADEVKNVLGIQNEDFSDFFCDDLKMEFAEFLKEKGTDSFTAQWRYQIEAIRQQNDSDKQQSQILEDVKMPEQSSSDTSKKLTGNTIQLTEQTSASIQASITHLNETDKKITGIVDEANKSTSEKQAKTLISSEVIKKSGDLNIQNIKNLAQSNLSISKADQQTSSENPALTAQLIPATKSQKSPATSLSPSTDKKAEDIAKQAQSNNNNFSSTEVKITVKSEPKNQAQVKANTLASNGTKSDELPPALSSQIAGASVSVNNKISASPNTTVSNESSLAVSSEVVNNNQSIDSRAKNNPKASHKSPHVNTLGSQTLEKSSIASKGETLAQKANAQTNAQVTIAVIQNQQTNIAEMTNNVVNSQKQAQINFPPSNKIQTPAQNLIVKSIQNTQSFEQNPQIAHPQSNSKQFNNPMNSSNIWVNDEFSGQSLNLLADLPTYSDISNGFSSMPSIEPQLDANWSQTASSIVNFNQVVTQGPNAVPQVTQNLTQDKIFASFKQNQEIENLRLNLLQIQTQEEENRKRTSMALKAKEDQDFIQKLYVILAYKRRQEGSQSPSSVKVRPTELFLLNSISKNNGGQAAPGGGSLLTAESLGMAKNQFNTYLSLSVQDLSNLVTQKERQFESGYEIAQPKPSVIKSQYTLPRANTASQNSQAFISGSIFANLPQSDQSKDANLFIRSSTHY